MSIDYIEFRRMVLAKTDGHCAYCGRALAADENWSVEHVIPRCAGGPSALGNSVPACWRCNMSKMGRSPDEWRAAMRERAIRRLRRLEQQLHHELTCAYALDQRDSIELKSGFDHLARLLRELRIIFWMDVADGQPPSASGGT